MSLLVGQGRLHSKNYVEIAGPHYGFVLLDIERRDDAIRYMHSICRLKDYSSHK